MSDTKTVIIINHQAMLTEVLKTLFTRDLLKVKREIELYQQESAIWKTEKQIPNAAGNLCLHLVGNLNTYIGATLDSSGYVRHRELEFSLKDIPKAELIRKIENTIVIVETALSKLTDQQLQEDYPLLVWEEKTSTEYLLIHLATHLSYHLGQINYHRRLLDTNT